MNYNEDPNKFRTIVPYKASPNNYNTSISNPNMQTGDPMGINIQNNTNGMQTMTTNQYLNNQTVPPQSNPASPNQAPSFQNWQVQSNYPSSATPTTPSFEQQPSTNQPTSNNSPSSNLDVTEVSYQSTLNSATTNQNMVTYVSNMNLPKNKKEGNLNKFLTPDIKITILIVIILILCIYAFPSIYETIAELKRNLS